jgi:hypothetical protein
MVGSVLAFFMIFFVVGIGFILRLTFNYLVFVGLNLLFWLSTPAVLWGCA